MYVCILSGQYNRSVSSGCHLCCGNKHCEGDFPMHLIKFLSKMRWKYLRSRFIQKQNICSGLLRSCRMSVARLTYRIHTRAGYTWKINDRWGFMPYPCGITILRGGTIYHCTWFTCLAILLWTLASKEYSYLWHIMQVSRKRRAGMTLGRGTEKRKSLMWLR